MASAKKGKKNKGKTLALSDFLQETPGTVSTVPIRKSTTNWADEVEDTHDSYEPRSVKTNVVLPTAPKASRDFDDIIDKVPQEPPFMAYISNLPYDVDENEIANFFRNMKVANMRIPKDDRPGEVPRLRGFGYIEFEDRESLLNALVIPDTMIKTRRIRIDLASESDLDKRRPGGRMDMNRDRNRNNDSSSFGDWRSGPRQETEGRSFRDRDRDRERDDGGMWRDDRRRGDNERTFTRRDDRDDKFIRRQDNRNGGGGFNRRDEEPRSEPKQRPKLMLTPRTKPVENEEKGGGASASIFGAAKPVDTAARERQIEERLAKDHEVGVKRDVSRDRQKEKEVHVEKEKEVVPLVLEKREKKSESNGVPEKEKEKDKEKGHQSDQEKKDTEKPKTDIKKKDEKKDKGDKEMPKLKKADPPNFVASNKFAFLENEDSSD